MKRRQFMELAAFSAIASTLPTFGWSRRARADGTTDIPKRVIFFYGGSGSMPGKWEPLALRGQPAPTETDWDLAVLHAPLAAHKDRLVYFENLDMLSQTLDPTPATNPHFAGMTHALTGANRVDSRLQGSASIDIAIANALNANGLVTTLPSLQLYGSHQHESPESYPSSVAAGQVVTYVWDPRDAYQRMYPLPLPVDGAVDPTLTSKARVLDFVRGEASALSAKLGTADRAKLEQHRAAVDELRARLTLSTGNRAANRPDPSILTPVSDVNFNFNGTPAEHAHCWDVTSDLHVKLAVAAVHSDVTRVVTLYVQDAPDAACGYTPGDFGSVDLHDLLHKVLNPTSAQAQNPAAVAVIQNRHALTMAKFKQLLDELAARTETDGSSLLDHTLVVWCSQIAHGGHDLTRLPWLLAGNVGGGLRTGRYLRHARIQNKGRPHNDLLVSIANLVGVPMTTFGNPAACNGPLSDL
jgi:hypothetical protein